MPLLPDDKLVERLRLRALSQRGRAGGWGYYTNADAELDLEVAEALASSVPDTQSDVEQAARELLAEEHEADMPSVACLFRDAREISNKSGYAASIRAVVRALASPAPAVGWRVVRVIDPDGDNPKLLWERTAPPTPRDSGPKPNGRDREDGLRAKPEGHGARQRNRPTLPSQTPAEESNND